MFPVLALVSNDEILEQSLFFQSAYFAAVFTLWAFLSHNFGDCCDTISWPYGLSCQLCDRSCLESVCLLVAVSHSDNIIVLDIVGA